MLIFGASGHAKVVIDCLESRNIPIECIFDDNLSKTELCGYKVLGAYDQNKYKAEKLIIAIGDNAIRKRISKKIIHKIGKIEHPSAFISKRATLNEGTVVFHNAVIQTEVLIGSHVIINTLCSIDHECIIADFVHISPKATLCGNVHIGEGTHIGASATVIPNIKIGKWVTVGAGAVIIKDIPDYSIVVGNPGRIVRYKDSSVFE
jgi:sugar O-acyltransferase (sialic acid O-acetyltransferase NeuD family)